MFDLWIYFEGYVIQVLVWAVPELVRLVGVFP